MYTKAIEACPSTEKSDVFYQNRAAAYEQLVSHVLTRTSYLHPSKEKFLLFFFSFSSARYCCACPLGKILISLVWCELTRKCQLNC